MTPTTLAAGPSRATDTRVIGLVGSAHFVSHVFILALPPMFPFVRPEFNVSYTELGLVMAVFNAISALLQTPAGFLVDRSSARVVLTGGLLLGSAALAASVMMPNFLLFGLMFAILGVANTVYHPADYALLSSRISPGFMGQAFSIHIFAGFIGSALTPAIMVALALQFGWRAAFLATALMGAIAAAAVMLFGDVLAGREAAHARAASGGTAPKASDWRVLMTWPVILNLVFFLLISSISVGIQNYGIVALEAMRGATLSFATTAVTVYLVCCAFAVLVGGWIAARTEKHDRVAMIGLAVSGIALAPVALFDIGTAVLMLLMALSGFFNGIIQPSRDMIVRAVTPPGAFGRVFGFVTTGFNIGGVLAPPAFGYMMDTGRPGLVILGAAALTLVTIPTVMITIASGERRKT
jgi:MFS family permease